jgi:hypothetical protein
MQTIDPSCRRRGCPTEELINFRSNTRRKDKKNIWS